MTKVTAAGMKVLRAFDKQEGDHFTISCLTYDQISVRTGLHRQVYKVTDKLEKDGLLGRHRDFSGRYLVRTAAGLAAAQGSTTSTKGVSE